MTIGSPGFLLFVGIVAVVFHLAATPEQRRFILVSASLLFLGTAVPNLQSVVWIALFVGCTFGILRIARARYSRRSVMAIIAVTIASFLYLKRYTFLTELLPPVLWQGVLLSNLELVGLSYMLFKFIHVLVDEWEGQLPPCGFLAYAAYQLAFFTLVAGPIQRFDAFQRFWNDPAPGPGDAIETLGAWSRILTGMIKMGMVAPLFWYFFQSAGHEIELQSGSALLQRFAVYFYSYPVYLYLNFAGYTDIAIGSAGLLGLRLPENFNRPYLARNIVDFWSRWHMSLSQWIRDYVFMTSYKALAERFTGPRKLLGYGLLFLSLLLAGMWHGSTLGFAVFGAIHGLGAAVSQVYGDALKSWLGPDRFRRYQGSLLIRCIAIGVTFHFVCFSFLFFSSGLERAATILERLVNRVSVHDLLSVAQGVPPAGGWVALAILILMALALGGARLGLWRRLTDLRPRTVEALYTITLAKSAFVTLVLLTLWSLGQADPVVVYMRF